MWEPLEAGTGKESNPPWQRPEGRQPSLYLDVSPVRRILTSDLRNCEITRVRGLLQR